MIIVTGSIAWDFIIDFPGKFADHIIPEEIHKLNISFNVEHYAKRRGGTAANAVYNLHLLNTKSMLFGAVGKDFAEYKEAYDAMGINSSSVTVDLSKYTSTGFAITDKTNNQIWGYSYGAAVGINKLRLQKVAKKGDIILIGPNVIKGFVGFIKEAIRMKLFYIFDPSFTLATLKDTDLELGINHSAIVVANDYEMVLIKNRLKNWKKLFVDKIVITTLGEKGAEIYSDGKIYKIKSIKPKKIVDPTGAGDAWRAGFLAGFERGFDLKTCGQMGALAATYAIEHYGTQEHKYTLSEFEKRYRQAYGSLIKL